VLSVMDWAVEAVEDYVENVRPRFGFPDHPALWITERGGRLQPSSINDRFEAYRDAYSSQKNYFHTQFVILTSRI
jgi:integrase/recombinase XerC